MTKNYFKPAFDNYRYVPRRKGSKNPSVVTKIASREIGELSKSGLKIQKYFFRKVAHNEICSLIVIKGRGRIGGWLLSAFMLKGHPCHPENIEVTVQLSTKPWEVTLELDLMLRRASASG